MTGDATGSVNPLSITMNGAMSITAGFAIDAFPVNVTVTGPGTVTRAPNLAAYNYGSTVQLTATPSANRDPDVRLRPRMPHLRAVLLARRFQVLIAHHNDQLSSLGSSSCKIDCPSIHLLLNQSVLGPL